MLKQIADKSGEPSRYFLLLPYILESNPHPFYIFRELKN
jgi:hypothetical protein